ncbi:hypothetical protein [Ancylobacter lacus]|uniref:hypothetical protein n=1 Tax=Ancylobacter lacus TaxID=2579970 RepID=UPI001BCEE2E8|nr:hypothetical protein [Ancylobacter lacus]MBS7540197.1 hypothetical protein [Ancylobacter lacus]
MAGEGGPNEIGKACTDRKQDLWRLVPTIIENNRRFGRLLADYNTPTRTWRLKPAALAAFQQLGFG